MKEIMKKVLNYAGVFLLLFVVMQIGKAGVKVEAATYRETIDTINWVAYENDDGMVTIRPDFNDDDDNRDNHVEAITIPSSIQGHTVNTIPEDAFYKTNFSSITIPDTITKIEQYAFEACNTTSITISDSVTEIGESAFFYCQKLVSIKLPSELTVIQEGTFDRCVKLESIQIPSKVTLIDDYAFNNCYSLTELTIPDSVKELGNGILSCSGGNSKLEKLYIGKGLENINVSNQFMYCKALSSINVNPENPYFTSVDGVLFDKKMEKLISCPPKIATEADSGIYTIPYGVLNVEKYAFVYNSSITNIVIPDTVTELDDYSFVDAYSLLTINFLGNISKIGFGCFIRCEKLEKILIPKGVTTISAYAFDHCSALKSVEIPDGVTDIKKCAFYYCSALESIEIPDNVTSIGDSAFYGCSALESIEVPDGVTSIGDSVFYGCSALESIEVPDGVTSIGGHAFYKCSALESIEIPDKVTQIAYEAFADCTSLKKVKMSTNVTIISPCAFNNCRALESIEGTDNVKIINLSAFGNCSSLKSINLPNLTDSYNYTFQGCEALDDLVISNKYSSNNRYSLVSCKRIYYIGTREEWQSHAATNRLYSDWENEGLEIHYLTPIIEDNDSEQEYDENNLYTISVKATPGEVLNGEGNGTLSYQWYSNTEESKVNGNLIEGATSEECRPSTDKEGTTYYYCVVTNSYDTDTLGTLTSSIVSDMVTVNISEAYTSYMVKYITNCDYKLKTQIVEENKPAPCPSEPEKKGYVFLGWYLEEACENAYDFDEPVTGDIVLYAKWGVDYQSLQEQ